MDPIVRSPSHVGWTQPIPILQGIRSWSGMGVVWKWRSHHSQSTHILKEVTIEVCISLPHNANSACPLNTGPMWRLLPSWHFDVQKDGAEVERKYPAPVPKVSWRRQAKHLLPNPLPWAHQTSLLPPTLYMFPQIFLAATSLVQVSLRLLFQQDLQHNLPSVSGSSHCHLFQDEQLVHGGKQWSICLDLNSFWRGKR